MVILSFRLKQDDMFYFERTEGILCHLGGRIQMWIQAFWWCGNVGFISDGGRPVAYELKIKLQLNNIYSF